MKAVTWQGRQDMRVEEVGDPSIREPTDAIVRVTSTAICGSDLHLYGPLSPLMEPGDIPGHEPMGIVEAVGSDVSHIAAGDRVVVPFNISCGHCFMCRRGLYAQCETTQVKEYGKGAALFGYTKLYGHVPGGQAQYLRVPQAHFGPIKVPEGPPDERFLYMSDVLPTAWQAVDWADIPAGGSVAVLGLGPIGQMATRIARHQGAGLVVGIDRVPERLAMAERNGITPVDMTEDDYLDRIREWTDGRGPDSVIDAVGLEAHGSPYAATAQKAVGKLPKGIAEKLTGIAGVDRLSALLTSLSLVRRGGTLSLIGVYGGQADALPMLDFFDKGVQIRMGQAHVRRWVDTIMPLLTRDDDPLGSADLETHRMPLAQAPEAYKTFQDKNDGCIKVVLQP